MNIYTLSVNGTHTSILKTFYETVKSSNQKGYYNIQVFLGSPYNLTRKIFSSDDIKKTKQYLDRHNLTVFTHLPYVINLAGSAKLNNYCWNGDKTIDTYVQECIKSIKYECDLLSHIQPSNKGGCVLHIGSIGKLTDREKGLRCVAESINKINFTKDSCKLILETMVGRGGVLGTSFEDLYKIYNMLNEDKKSYIGICIDTCHIFAEGLYKLDGKEDIDKMFNDFQKYFNIEKLSLFHLNDSICDYNSKQDRHSTLMNGCIWKDKVNGLKYFIECCKKLNIPMILETEESDYNVVEKL
jgi:deoxyribonuclease IV